MVTRGGLYYDIIMQRASLPDCILKTPSRIDLLPSNLKTANLDVELLGVIKFHERMSDALSDLPEEAYDYVILDCPPNLSMNTLNAFDAVSHLMNTLLKVTGGKATIRPYGLPTFMNRTNLARDIYELTQERFQSPAFPQSIRTRGWPKRSPRARRYSNTTPPRAARWTT